MTRRSRLDRAAELVDEGWETLYGGDGRRAAENARRALELDPQAIDAFVILAHAEQVPAVRIAVPREGVRTGETMLADALKAWRQVDFWLDLDTRSYMRAVHFLALELWARNGDGDRHEAARLAAHLLKINPNDNQGVRMLVYNWYPPLGRWDDLARLLRCYRK